MVRRSVQVKSAVLAAALLAPLFVATPASGQGAFECAGETATIVGSPGDDVIVGTSGRDVIVALGGDDVIQSLAGADIVCGGDGADTIIGGKANDTLIGGSGNDTISGGRGHDNLFGSSGTDTVRAQGGNDFISGGNGNDNLFGGSGNDEVNGNNGGDLLRGGGGNDVIRGGGGSDDVNGQGGSNLVAQGSPAIQSSGPLENGEATCQDLQYADYSGGRDMCLLAFDTAPFGQLQSYYHPQTGHICSLFYNGCLDFGPLGSDRRQWKGYTFTDHPANWQSFPVGSCDIYDPCF